MKIAQGSSQRTVVLLAVAMLTLGGCDRISWPWTDNARNGAIVLSGTVDAREIDLSFQVGGRILKLGADEGDRVTAGQVVAELDPRDLELAHTRARAQAASSEKALAVLKAGSRAQEIRAGEAAFQQAKADLKLAQASRERTAQLVAQNFQSRQVLDTATDQLEVARAKLEQARQNLSLLREGARKEDIERATADLDSARAAADTAAQQLAYARLVSAIDGVVSVRLADRGQNVAAGQGVLRVAEISRPWVRVYLGEKDLPRVKLGQVAEITVDGIPGRTFRGRLSFISPEAEFTPKTVETRALRVDLVYRAKVDVDDAGGLLKIGMPADVRLQPAS